MNITEDEPQGALPLDTLLNHRAKPVIYLGHKGGASVEDIAVIYKTTPNVIRAILRKYHREFVARKLAFVPDQP